MMKKYLLSFLVTILVILAIEFAAVTFAQGQSTYKIGGRCAAPYSKLYGSVTVTTAGINNIPCPTKSTTFSGGDGALDFRQTTSAYGSKLFLGETSFVPIFPAPLSTHTLTAGYSTRQNITGNDQYFTGTEFGFPITMNGTTGFGIYQGNQIWLDVQGSGTAVIRGQGINVFSNGSFPTAGAEIGGVDVSVDVGGAYSEAFGGRYSVIMGGSGASGIGTFYGLQSVVGAIHNGNAGAAYAGDFWILTGAGSPGTLTTGSIVRAHTNVRGGATFTTLRGIDVSAWVLQGDGNVTNSYGIYMDSSIDVGTSTKYALYSLSASPSLFSGVVRVTKDVYITDNTKGMVLKSPDGTCYRYTAANGGALNAGAAVTCP